MCMLVLPSGPFTQQIIASEQKKSAAQEYYDVTDPFIDDSELAVDERTFFAQTKQQGFYVSSGQVALLTDKYVPITLHQMCSVLFFSFSYPSLYSFVLPLSLSRHRTDDMYTADEHQASSCCSPPRLIYHTTITFCTIFFNGPSCTEIPNTRKYSASRIPNPSQCGLLCFRCFCQPRFFPVFRHLAHLKQDVGLDNCQHWSTRTRTELYRSPALHIFPFAALCGLANTRNAFTVTAALVFSASVSSLIQHLSLSYFARTTYMRMLTVSFQSTGQETEVQKGEYYGSGCLHFSCTLASTSSCVSRTTIHLERERGQETEIGSRSTGLAHQPGRLR